MKKLQIMIYSVALMGICTLAQAQDTDTTSTNYNAQPRNEESSQDTRSDDMKTNDAERADDQQPQSTDQQLEQDADAMQKNFEGSTIDKVGPHGEKVFMEKGKYYYINDQGKRVKVKKSDVVDMSQHP
jgi:hypothetical protein